MQRPPRNTQTPILTPPLVMRIFLVGFLLLIGAFGLFAWELHHGESEATARTAAVNVFVFGELFYLFNCRSLRYSMFRLGFFSNPLALIGAACMILLQCLFTYAGPMNRAFGSTPIGLSEWALILGIGLLIYFAVGLEKWIRNRVSSESMS